MTASSKHTFKTLDGVRGIAAIAVMVSHFGYGISLPIFREGYLAVDIFFCLSGFVVACAYEERLKERLSVGRFLKTRIVRFWPMIALGVLGGALVYFVVAKVSSSGVQIDYFGASIVLNLVFMPVFFGANGSLFLIDHPEWSLFYELIINAAYAMLVRWLSTPRIATILAVSSIVLAIGILELGSVNIGWERSQLVYGLARVSYGFFAGVLLFRCRQKFGGLRFRHGAFLVLLSTAVVCTFPAGHFRPYFDCLFVLAGAPVLVFWGSNASEPGWIDGLSAFLGTISYPLYAIHFPLAVLAYFLATLFPQSTTLIIATIAVSTIPLSYVLAKLYDEPFRRFLSRAWGLGGDTGEPSSEGLSALR